MPSPSLVIAACLIVGVIDGDTLTAKCDGTEVKVRLAEIDAPEKKQAFGQNSKQSLSSLCFNKHADVYIQTTDRYGRSVARVVCNGTDANAAQISRGMAWVYDKYATDPHLYQLQEIAISERRGLWKDSDPIQPWEWRQQHR